MASIRSMHEFFYGEREPVGYIDVHYEQLHPTTFDLMVREAAPVFIYVERESVGYNDVHYEQLHPTTIDLMVREAAPVFIYAESGSFGYNDVHYEQLHPTTFDLMVREAAPVFIYAESGSLGYNDVHYEQLHPTTFDLMESEAAPPVHGCRELAEAFGSGASSSCNDGATFTRKSSRVQEGNRDRRSYVDMRDSQRYAWTVCPGYKGSPAITHYVSVNPTMATRMESGVAWPN